MRTSSPLQVVLSFLDGLVKDIWPVEGSIYQRFTKTALTRIWSWIFFFLFKDLLNRPQVNKQAVFTHWWGAKHSTIMNTLANFWKQRENIATFWCNAFIKQISASEQKAVLFRRRQCDFKQLLCCKSNRTKHQYAINQCLFTPIWYWGWWF